MGRLRKASRTNAWPTTLRRAPTPRSAVWIQAGLPVSLLVSAASGRPTLYLPIGASFNLGGHPVALEVTPIYDRDNGGEVTWRSQGLITAIGPMLLPVRSRCAAFSWSRSSSFRSIESRFCSDRLPMTSRVHMVIDISSPQASASDWTWVIKSYGAISTLL